MRAAYDALPADSKERLGGLVGLHGRSTGPAGERLYGDDKGATEKKYDEMPRPAVIQLTAPGRIGMAVPRLSRCMISPSNR